VAELDWSVGEVLAKLKRAGLEDNTLVMFSTVPRPQGHELGGRGASAVCRALAGPHPGGAHQ
jgi:hypothetical protein